MWLSMVNLLPASFLIFKGISSLLMACRLLSFGRSCPGGILHSICNSIEARAITLVFTNKDTRILAAFHDRAVRCFDIGQTENEWRYVHPQLFKEVLTAEAAANSPTCVAFNRDGSYAGVAYRGFSLSIWSLMIGEFISRCNRG